MTVSPAVTSTRRPRRGTKGACVLFLCVGSASVVARRRDPPSSRRRSGVTFLPNETKRNEAKRPDRISRRTSFHRACSDAVLSSSQRVPSTSPSRCGFSFLRPTEESDADSFFFFAGAAESVQGGVLRAGRAVGVEDHVPVEDAAHRDVRHGNRGGLRVRCASHLASPVDQTNAYDTGSTPRRTSWGCRTGRILFTMRRGTWCRHRWWRVYEA